MKEWPTSDYPLVALPYDRGLLPSENFDEIDSVDLARLEALLFADHAVTPSEVLAGTRARLPDGEVIYVTSADFARYVADLESLVPDLGDLHSDTRVSTLRGHPAIDFIEGLVAQIDEPLRDED